MKKNRKPHTHRILDKVLVRNKKSDKYEDPYVGSYQITQLWTDGNVTICQGDVQERMNITWIKRYHE